MAALRTRLRGGWTPGVWNIGRFGLLVNVVAVCWLAFEIVNIAWPRLPDAAWYVNYGAVSVVVLVTLGGFATRAAMRRPDASTAAARDGLALEQGGSR
jgi:hypothetical protein